MELQDRVARVRLLLLTLDDPYPTPRGALRSDSGPAASKYVPCETCRRQGRVRTRSGLALCLVCDGVGWKRREAREVEWCSYTELPVVEAADLPSMPSGTPRPEENGDTPYSWEVARASYDRHGSYKEVRTRLDWLGKAEPFRHGLVRTHLVEKEPRFLSDYNEVEMDLGVVQITLRMRSIRVPPWIMERSAASERRETIAALHADGYSAGEIARRTGMTRKAVRRRIRGASALHSGQAGAALGRA